MLVELPISKTLTTDSFFYYNRMAFKLKQQFRFFIFLFSTIVRLFHEDFRNDLFLLPTSHARAKAHTDILECQCCRNGVFSFCVSSRDVTAGCCGFLRFLDVAFAFFSRLAN